MASVLLFFLSLFFFLCIVLLFLFSLHIHFNFVLKNMFSLSPERERSKRTLGYI